MCGSTTEEHTCSCCRPGEPRRARDRARYARTRAVREYRRARRSKAPGAGVTTDGEWVIGLARDPRQVTALAAIETFGPEVRDSSGRIAWLRVSAEHRWMRGYEGTTAPAPVRITPGLVSADGRIDETMLATKTPAQQALLRDLVAAAFEDLS